jgi:hypothetical protein
MSDFYKTTRNKDWNYGGPKWKLSRSKIDLFMECPRCFYIDNKLGLARPRGPSFTLNIAVDALLKKEFDIHRVAKTAHPLMEQYKVDALPFTHKELDNWRENFVGIQFKHEKTGMTISGAIDDVWVNPKGELIIVDYKATAKDGKMDSLDDTKWQQQYKRQMEVYQWLFRQKGFDVSDTGYFVYVNGRADKKAFDGKLEFDVTLIAHTGEDSWVEKTILKIKECLDDDRIPAYSQTCDYCNYITTMGNVLRNAAKPENLESKNRSTKLGTGKTKKKSEESTVDAPKLFDN